MQNNKITEDVYAMKRMKNTIYERKGINMFTVYTTERCIMNSRTPIESINYNDMKCEYTIYNQKRKKYDAYLANDIERFSGLSENSTLFGLSVKNTNKQNYNVHHNNHVSMNFNAPQNFNVHQNEHYKTDSSLVTSQIIGNTVKINDFDRIRTDINKKDSNVESILDRNHYMNIKRRKHPLQTFHCCDQNKIDLFKRPVEKLTTHDAQCIVGDSETKLRRKNEILKDSCKKIEKSTRVGRPPQINHKMRFIDVKMGIRKRSNSLIVRNCVYPQFYDLLKMSNTSYHTTLRDETLYCIYKMYNMMDNIFYSSFLSNLATFSFINIVLGLKIFKSYLSISPCTNENLDFLYSVCCVMASKYLDDIHVYNNCISNCSLNVNKLEMKILSTLKYSIEFDMVNFYDTMDELFS